MTVLEILRPLPPAKREDALWLLSAFFGCSKAEVLLNRARALTVPESRHWKNWWRRRLQGEPLQYICGEAPFFGREFCVNRHTLIPRPETERLVELVLPLVRRGDRVLDIGTGTGCIAVTLKLENPALSVTGTDVSMGALKVAGANAKRLAADVRFEKQDLFSPSLRKRPWNVVVSNPPYLDFNRDKIAANVRGWEPRTALEPLLPSTEKATPRDRASWCAERILEACSEYGPRYTALELSARVASTLERKWNKHPEYHECGARPTWLEENASCW